MSQRPSTRQRNSGNAPVLSRVLTGLTLSMVVASGACRAVAQGFTVAPPVNRAIAPASRIVLADFNLDGHADLATVGSFNGDSSHAAGTYLQIYLGDGTGSFSTSPDAYTQVDQCASVKTLAAFAVDVTGSQNLALLCADTLQIWHIPFTFGGTPAISLSNSAANRQVITLTTPGQTMAISDLFGNGNAGVVVLEAGYDIYNHYLEYFGPTSGCTPLAACRDSSGALAQVVSSATLTYDLSTFLAADEQVTALTTLPQPGSSTPALVIVTSFGGNCGGTLLSLLPQSYPGFGYGDKTFLDAGLCATAAASGGYSQQGQPALVIGGSQLSGGGFLATYNGFGDGGFNGVLTGSAAITTYVRAPIDSNGLAMLDVNGDGNADILVAGPYASGVSGPGDTFSLYLGAGDGTFTFSQTPGPNVNTTNSASVGTGVIALAASTINSDGAPDIVAIDLVGDGTGGGIGTVSNLVGSLVQVFGGESIPTTTTLTADPALAGIGGIGGGPDPGFTRRLSKPRPNAYGSVNSGDITLTAQVSPADAQGWVQFFDATTQSWVGSAQLSYGSAVLTVSGMSGHIFVASYYGGSPYIGSNSTPTRATPALVQTSVQIDINPAQAAPGTSIDFYAYIFANSGTPTGTVTFIDNNTGNTLATASVDGSGNAEVFVSNLPVGQYDVIATYSGDAAFLPSTSVDNPLTIAIPLIPDTVTLAVSTTTLTYPATTTATATFTSSGATNPTGSVSFQVDGVTVATATISGTIASATFTPAVGQHGLQAIYLGDAVAAPATSNIVPITVHGGVLQFTPATATTFAGIPATSLTASYSGDNGPATAARLHTPFGLTTSAGNVYIADEQNNVIRKVAPDGTITTVAGQQYVGNYYYTRFGGDGGLATNAYLSNPTGVAVDATGNLFIADYSNNVVRRVDAVTGIITTVVGSAGNTSFNGYSGPASAIHLSRPESLVFDAAGNLFIADAGSSLILKVDPSGNLTTVAGQYGYYGNPVYNTLATSSSLRSPQGIAVDSAGNIYIADTGNSVVSKVDTFGIVRIFAGGSSSYAPNFGDGGPATSASLNQPTQLAVDAAGNVYISDSINNIIRKVDTSGIITTVVGVQDASGSGPYDPAGAAATAAPLIAPQGIAVDSSGTLFVSDTANQTVWRVGPTGAILFGPQATGTTSTPQYVTLQNVGDTAIVFNNPPFTITGDYAVAPGGTNPCNFISVFYAGSSCTVAVTYTPTTNALSGSVVFSGTMSGSPTIIIQTNLNPTVTVTNFEVSSNTSEIGQQVLLYAYVSAVPNSALPTGTYSFYDGSTFLGSSASVPASGSSYGYIQTSTLAIGNHSLSAVYSGDSTYAGSTSASQPVTITLINTSVTLSASNTSPAQGAAVTLTATAYLLDSGAILPQGAISFFDGSNLIGTVSVNSSGVATLTTSSLSVGTHAIRAYYVADSTYGVNLNVNQVTVQVQAASGGGGSGGFGSGYFIQSAGVPVVIHRGQTATLSLTLEAVGSSVAFVPLSCGTLPAYATCSFSPATVIVGGPFSMTQTVIWTITTTSPPQGALLAAPVQVGGHGLPSVTIR